MSLSNQKKHSPAAELSGSEHKQQPVSQDVTPQTPVALTVCVFFIYSKLKPPCWVSALGQRQATVSCGKVCLFMLSILCFVFMHKKSRISKTIQKAVG